MASPSLAGLTHGRLPGPECDESAARRPAQRYETRWRLIQQVVRKADWSAVIRQANASAQHGFLRYWSSDVKPLMSLAGVPTPCANYLMGNHM
jgi:hypothetical protein